MLKLTIAGKTFEAPARYEAGHVLTANEAASLNQTMLENVGNNFRKRVKDGKETLDTLQAAFFDYVKGYSFGVRTARTASPGDPVGAEAIRLALAFIKDKIRNGGKKVADYTTVQLNEAASKLVEKDPAYRSTAEATIAARKSIAPAHTDLDDLIGAPQPKGEGTPPEGASNEGTTVTNKAKGRKAA